MRQEMTGFGDAAASAGTYAKMCNWLQTDNHTNDPSLNLYRPDALPDTQPTVSKHWREFIVVVMQEFQTTGGSSPPCWEGRSLLFWVRGEPQARGPNWSVGCWHGICLERGADLHMAQLMPLPLTVSCFSKIQIGFTFLVPAYPVPEL